MGIRIKKNYVVLQSDFRGSVQLTNVMFNYPTRPDIMVLKGK